MKGGRLIEVGLYLYTHIVAKFFETFFYIECSVTIAESKCCDVIFMNGHLLSLQVSVIKAKLHEITGMPAGKQKLQLGVRKSMKI